MFPQRRFAVLLISVISLAACTTSTTRIQTDDLPGGSLRVAQIVEIADRDTILKLEAYPAIKDAGVPDADLVDGSIAMARIYCCGGPTREASAEYTSRRMLYVPKDISVKVDDFVEVMVGRPPEIGDGGSLNTVTRIVARETDHTESCWWEPKNDKLWLRYAYCEWMPQEGWVKREVVPPVWYKPAPYFSEEVR